MRESEDDGKERKKKVHTLIRESTGQRVLVCGERSSNMACLHIYCSLQYSIQPKHKWEIIAVIPESWDPVGTILLFPTVKGEKKTRQPHHFLFFSFSRPVPATEDDDANIMKYLSHTHPFTEKKENKTKDSEQPKNTTGSIASDTVSEYGRVFWRRRPDDLLGEASAAGKHFSHFNFFSVCVVFFLFREVVTCWKKKKGKKKKKKTYKTQLTYRRVGNYFAVFSEEKKNTEKNQAAYVMF